MSTPKKIFWTILGFVLFLVCFLKVQYIFVAPRTLVYHFLGEFYKEPKNSLDAVIIGASQAYDSWSAPMAFSQYGMTSWAFCSPRLSAQSIIYFLEEVRRTQPDALPVINLNIFHNVEIDESGFNWSVNYLPYSLNKLRMVRDIGEQAGYSLSEQLRVLFPVLRFHSRWTELTPFFFLKPSNGLKSAMLSEIYRKESDDISELYLKDDRTSPIDPRREAVLRKLLDYCRKKNIAPLFVIVPEAMGDLDGFITELNAIKSVIRENGFECLDYLNEIEETGLNSRTDFTDPRHMNIHGTLKFAPLLAQYLSEHYGFSDKRGQAGYGSWEEAVQNYNEQSSPFILPFERENAPRNYDLAAPKLKKPQAEGQTVTLTWNASKGADSYEIYRKTAKEDQNGWTLLASADADTLQYTDSGLAPSQIYTYTVVPKTAKNGIEQYGNYKYNGISVRTGEPEPQEEP